MNEQWHAILKRHIKKKIAADLDQYPKGMDEFLDAISQVLYQSDEDRAMIERSLDISSKELTQKNQELQTVFQSLPDFFLWVNKSGKIISTDSAVSPENFFEYKKLVGENIKNIFEADVFQKFEDFLTQASDENKMFQTEYKINLNNQLAFFEARLLIIEHEKVLIIIRDISDRKKAEDKAREVVQARITMDLEQKKMEELEAKNQQLNVFFNTAVDREKRMIQLKEEANEISEKFGLPAPYDLSFKNEVLDIENED